MHDFCFTIPYGIFVLVGGLIAYARKRSIPSLAGGAGVGLLLLLAGFVSLKAFEKRKNSFLPFSLRLFIFDAVCSVALTVVMGRRYLETSKIMPAGFVAAISALMTIFYLYKIVQGGNHIPSKAK